MKHTHLIKKMEQIKLTLLWVSNASIHGYGFEVSISKGSTFLGGSCCAWLFSIDISKQSHINHSSKEEYFIIPACVTVVSTDSISWTLTFLLRTGRLVLLRRTGFFSAYIVFSLTLQIGQLSLITSHFFKQSSWKWCLSCSWINQFYEKYYMGLHFSWIRFSFSW